MARFRATTRPPRGLAYVEAGTARTTNAVCSREMIDVCAELVAIIRALTMPASSTHYAAHSHSRLMAHRAPRMISM